MAPDMSEHNHMAMDFPNKMPAIENTSSDDFDYENSSYSEVEISIESDKAMTDDDSSEESEESFQQFEGEYDELVDLVDIKDELPEEQIIEDVSFEDLSETVDRYEYQTKSFKKNQNLHHQNHRTSFFTNDAAASASTLPNTKSSSTFAPMKAAPKPSSQPRQITNTNTNTNTNVKRETPNNNANTAPTSERRRNYEEIGKNRRPPPPTRERIQRIHSISTDATPTTESDDITASSRANSKSPQKINTTTSNSDSNGNSNGNGNGNSNGNSNGNGNSNSNGNSNGNSNSNGNGNSNSNTIQQPTILHGTHKSIKIPALHNAKHDEDGDYDADYLKKQLSPQGNNDRRSRSRSRSNKSESSNHKPGHRKSRSMSSSKNQQQQQQTRSNSNNDTRSQQSSSSHQRRTNSNNPKVRRLSSIHTSTPSNQLTGSTSRTKSSSSKHSNYDGSKRVSWKSDPKVSFSDWTLHVLYRDSVSRKRRIDVYHLHRNVVGFGHRKSNFLLRDIMDVELKELFDTSKNMEVELQELLIDSGKNNRSGGRPKKDTIITRLKLPTESQARSVPMVLDFMYFTNETKQRMSADRSCNVFKVAEGLEVEALQKAIGEFYMKNLSLKNLAEFLTAATKFRADKLLTICKAKIGQMITVKPELSAMVPPKFMAEILSISSKQLVNARAKQPEKYTDELIVSQSRYWSKAACICAAKNESIMTPKIFRKLTSEESLPYIDVSATPKLMSMESTFLVGETGRRNVNQLTSLQRRCVESIGDDFDAFQKCFDSHQEIAESLKHLPSNILSEILMKLLTRP